MTGTLGKSVRSHQLNEILVVNVVGLLQTIVGADDFTERIVVRGRENRRRFCDELDVTCFLSRKGILVEECCRHIEGEGY